MEGHTGDVLHRDVGLARVLTDGEDGHDAGMRQTARRQPDTSCSRRRAGRTMAGRASPSPGIACCCPTLHRTDFQGYAEVASAKPVPRQGFAQEQKKPAPLRCPCPGDAKWEPEPCRYIYFSSREIALPHRSNIHGLLSTEPHALLRRQFVQNQAGGVTAWQTASPSMYMCFRLPGRKVALFRSRTWIRDQATFRRSTTAPKAPMFNRKFTPAPPEWERMYSRTLITDCKVRAVWAAEREHGFQAGPLHYRRPTALNQ